MNQKNLNKETSLKKHIIILQEEQRQRLEALISKGQTAAQAIKHAQLLL